MQLKTLDAQIMNNVIKVIQTIKLPSSGLDGLVKNSPRVSVHNFPFPRISNRALNSMSHLIVRAITSQ